MLSSTFTTNAYYCFSKLFHMLTFLLKFLKNSVETPLPHLRTQMPTQRCNTNISPMESLKAMVKFISPKDNLIRMRESKIEETLKVP